MKIKLTMDTIFAIYRNTIPITTRWVTWYIDCHGQTQAAIPRLAYKILINNNILYIMCINTLINMRMYN